MGSWLGPSGAGIGCFRVEIQSHGDDSQTAKTGLIAERSRFRHPGVPSARAAAFQATGHLQR